ncbi:MAG TPA: VWA domain-containing protein [Blastocatellia bacterium]|nr:VWA domain-containing protein [Blastocatellia bacterium]
MQFGRPTIRLCVLPFLALACLAGQEPPSGKMIELRVTVNRKGDGSPVILKREDLRLLEDNKPQELLDIRQLDDMPLSLAILFDTSASQKFVFKYEQQAANALIDQIIRAGIDQACVVTITAEPQLKQSLTGDKDLLKEAVYRLTPDESPITSSKKPPPDAPGGTSIYDSVWFSCEEILSKTPENARKAILLISDGMDTTSKKKRREVSDQAIRSGVAIYAIGIGDPSMGGVSNGTLSGLAQDTGGRAFYPKKLNETSELIEQLGRELKTCFLVGFRSNSLNPTTSGRNLKTEIANPELRKQKIELAYQRKHFAQ